MKRRESNAQSAIEKNLRVLIVEDSEGDALLLLRELRKGGYETLFERVETAEAMKNALGNEKWDLVISDYVLPRFSGIDALEIYKESGLDMPFIILSGKIGEDIAVSAMKAGAHDYILNGNLARLIPAIERELREAEVRRERGLAEADRTRFMTAIQNATDAIVVTDTNWVILYVNSAFGYITGYTGSEAVGQKMNILRSGKHDDGFYDEINETLKQGKIWSGRIINKKKDGTLYEEDTTISPAKDPSGKIVNYVAIKRDMTEKLKLESIAEAVNIMNNIGYVFSGLRHEIGNPINSIKMTLNVLRKNLDKYDREIIMEYIDRALSESSRVEYLLKSLKSFNMFERPEMEIVEVNTFSYNFYKLVFGDCMRGGITATRTVDPDVQFFYVDPRALQQVLLNIFTNAMDACDGRKDPVINFMVSRASDTIRLRIADNGKGMTRQQLDDLFKPFRTSKSKGTGLGLVICKKMLASMGCLIEIQSKEGIGTTVDIFIPEGKSSGQ